MKTLFPWHSKETDNDSSKSNMTDSKYLFPWQTKEGIKEGVALEMASSVILKGLIVSLSSPNYEERDYIHTVVNFKDPDMYEDLIIFTNDGRLDLGLIVNVVKSTSEEKEFWTIHTFTGSVTFEVLRKPEWIEVPYEPEEELTDEERVRLKSELNETMDKFINSVTLESVFGKMKKFITNNDVECDEVDELYQSSNENL